MNNLTLKSVAAALCASAACIAPSGPVVAGTSTVEVLHGWTSGGEAAAVQVLKKALEANGYTWIDMPVAGGGGEAATTVLRARATAGNPPTAAQVNGLGVQEWAKNGFLQSVDEVATAGDWDKVVPAAIRNLGTYNGQWVAAPVNVHRPNWLWINAKIFAANGLKPPTTWEEFNAIARGLKAKGITPLAHGGQPWQDDTIFDDVVVGIGGPEFYKAAILNLDEKALSSDTMVKVFDEMRTIRGFVDDNFSGRDWNLATTMVINGTAAMQLMGDWAKGEMIKAGVVPGKDILCVAAPGTEGTFLFNSDYFEMFKVGNDQHAAQLAFAKTLMDPNLQVAFNLIKGSVPARTDVSDEKFDACGKKSMRDLVAAGAAGTLFGANSANTGQPPAIQHAIFDVVTEFFNSDMSSKDAVARLVSSIREAK